MAALLTRSRVALMWLVVSLMCIAVVTGRSVYNPYLYGTNNYLASSLYNGVWWMQNQCHWGVRGLRTNSLYQCGTFSCPTMWYGSTQYMCPPPSLYSNSLQRCVLPSALASVRKCARTG